MNAQSNELRAKLIMAGYNQVEQDWSKMGKYFALYKGQPYENEDMIFIDKNKSKYLLMHPDLKKRVSYNITHNTFAELLGIK